MEQGVCGSEGHAVVAADVGGQATIFEQALKYSESVVFLGGRKRFTSEEKAAGVVGNGERLPSALRWYIDGFEKRSRIKVDLEFPDDFGRLPRELETAIFRVVQECLTNIHRHSQSPIAKIRIAYSDDLVVVEVEDQGKGIPNERLIEMDLAGLPGVGVRGMRERIRQLGGSLDIKSSKNGTIIRAVLPTASTSSDSAA